MEGLLPLLEMIRKDFHLTVFNIIKMLTYVMAIAQFSAALVVDPRI